MTRPELQAPPEIFYNDTEARKYTTSSRIIEIQAKISERALELLNLPNDGVPRLLLDIGCGSGLSGETLSENGHHWIGFDISQSMLDIALEREVEGDLLLADMGQGLGLRPGVIDGAISISAIQDDDALAAEGTFSVVLNSGAKGTSGTTAVFILFRQMLDAFRRLFDCLALIICRLCFLLSNFFICRRISKLVMERKIRVFSLLRRIF